MKESALTRVFIRKVSFSDAQYTGCAPRGWRPGYIERDMLFTYYFPMPFAFVVRMAVRFYHWWLAFSYDKTVLGKEHEKGYRQGRRDQKKNISDSYNDGYERGRKDEYARLVKAANNMNTFQVLSHEERQELKKQGIL